jgi:hypothetical protein
MDKNEVIIKIALITISNINEYFADNNKPLTMEKFVEIQQNSFKEAQEQ